MQNLPPTRLIHMLGDFMLKSIFLIFGIIWFSYGAKAFIEDGLSPINVICAFLCILFVFAGIIGLLI